MVGAEGFEPVLDPPTKTRTFCDLDAKQRESMDLPAVYAAPAFSLVYTRNEIPRDFPYPSYP